MENFRERSSRRRDLVLRWYCCRSSRSTCTGRCPRSPPGSRSRTGSGIRPSSRFHTQLTLENWRLWEEESRLTIVLAFPLLTDAGSVHHIVAETSLGQPTVLIFVAFPKLERGAVQSSIKEVIIILLSKSSPDSSSGSSTERRMWTLRETERERRKSRKERLLIVMLRYKWDLSSGVTRAETPVDLWSISHAEFI